MSLHAKSSVSAPAFYELLLTDLAVDALAPSITFTEDSIVRLAWAVAWTVAWNLHNCRCHLACLFL
jgi:hypothetical protein